METSKIIAIPNHWMSPKYSLGQRTKQGVIVGIQYYPPNNLLTGLCNESWRYAVLDKNDFSEVSHLEEQKFPRLHQANYALNFKLRLKRIKSKL